MLPSKGTTRAEALTDGTFAIVMTLLVIEMHPPEVGHMNELVEEIVVYGISFVLLGTYWIAHYNLFHWIKGVDHKLLWLNIWFLSMVSLIPFSTAYLIESHGAESATRWYAGHAFLILGSLASMSWYVIHRGLLEHESAARVKIALKLMSVPAAAALLT